MKTLEKNMSTPRISKEYNGETMFLTITVIEWINIFTDKKYFDILLNSLKFCQKNKGLLIFGYVFMTNHLHLIVAAKNNLDTIIRDFKHFTTISIKDLLLQDRRQYILKLITTSFSKKKENEQFQIWQRENYPEVIINRKFFQQKLDYIHNNPVKKGYVLSPTDWLYSSAKNYYLNDHSLIKINEF